MQKASRTVMWVGIGLAILAGLAAATIITTDQKRRIPAADTSSEAENTEQIVGGDKDAHGCLGSAGYSWCEEKQKCLRTWEEACGNDESFNLMREMEKTIGIDFTGIGPVQFEWNARQDQRISVTGTGFSIPEPTNSEYMKIKNYFNTHGFIPDPYNTAAGTMVSMTGYEKEGMVCLVNSKTDPENPLEVQIKCGELTAGAKTN